MGKTAIRTDTWRDAEAQARFDEVVQAAVDGRPQYVKRDDGCEVVVVSREQYAHAGTKLKEFLLRGGFADNADDAFDRALRDIRDEGSPFINPKAAKLTD